MSVVNDNNSPESLVVGNVWFVWDDARYLCGSRVSCFIYHYVLYLLLSLQITIACQWWTDHKPIFLTAHHLIHLHVSRLLSSSVSRSLSLQANTFVRYKSFYQILPIPTRPTAITNFESCGISFDTNTPKNPLNLAIIQKCTCAHIIYTH